MQVLSYTAGAHPGLSGAFTILRFADSSASVPVVYLERFTSDLYLEKPSDVRHCSVLHDHLQALSPDSSRDFITDITKTYVDAAATLSAATTGER